MTKQQQGKKKSPVILAVGFLALALIAFGAAFYYFDGMSVVDSFLGTDVVADNSVGATTGGSQDATSTAGDGLRLPGGMSEDDALRMWQEQIDSQANIEKLPSGDIDKIVITGVEQDGDASTLSIRAHFADDTSAEGVIGMEKYGAYWFFEYVTGLRGGPTGGSADSVAIWDGAAPTSSLPSLEDVDIDVLNTIIAQQVSSADVLTAYADGDIEEIVIGEITEGPGTETLAAVMVAQEDEITGDVVVISREVEGKTYWFIAKFTKS